MAIQTFSAETAEAAFAKIKKTLGSAAVIIDVHRGPRGVRVSAAPASKGSSMQRFFAGGAQVGANSRGIEADSDMGATTVASATVSSAGLRVVGGSGLGPSLRGNLQQIDFPPDLLSRVCAVGGSREDGWERLGTWLKAEHPPLVGRIRGQVGPVMIMGFMGPRGVGRSTLVRGLAARAATSNSGGVVWLRIGFPRRRLEALADVDLPVGVDVRTVNSIPELRRLTRDLVGVSAILIDLPGVNVHAESELAALGKFVAACNASWDRVYWNAVAPATWSTRAAAHSAQALAELGAEALAWTCLDQAGDTGTLLATTLRSGLPPSFLHSDRLGDGSTSNAASWRDVLDPLQNLGTDEQEQQSEGLAVAR